MQSKFKKFDTRMRMSRTLALLITIFALSISACWSTITQANTVPEACLNDSGNPVEPLPIPGAWAIILNFNHTPSATHTEACWAIRDDDQAMAISYTSGILCQVRNNTEGVMVGNGSAEFDGNYHITCPRREQAPDPNVSYDSFYVHAEASFDDIEAAYPLVRHSNVAVRTRFEGPDANGNWTATVRSRYGGVIFEDSKEISVPLGQRHHFNSVVKDSIGSHFINKQQVNSEIAVTPFGFDYTELIFIGGGANPWTLHEMVIDPPG